MPWRNQKDSKDDSGKKDSPQGLSPWGGGQEKDKDKDKKPSFGSQPRGSDSRNSAKGEPSLPDIDKFLRNGQERIKHIGGGFIAALIVILAFIFWLFHCFYIVQQNEQAVELRFGKPKQTIAEEGLHFYLWPIDTYRKVPRTEQTITIGSEDGEGLMLSGDQNIVNVNFSVYYYITDPSAYLFNVRDQSGTVAQVAESAMREVVGRRPADDVYRNRREIVAGEVRTIIQSTLNKYKMGIEVGRVSIREAAPPRQVVDAFNAVQQAEQERNRSIEQGNQERARLRGLANGQASAIREKAAAYKARLVEEARGEAQRFILVEKEAKTAPDITRFRLYLETMEQILSSPHKLVIGNAISGAGVIPYLPLDNMLRQNKGQIALAPHKTERALPSAGGNTNVFEQNGARLSAPRLHPFGFDMNEVR